MVPNPNQIIEDRPVGKRAYFPYKVAREENDKKLFRDISEANIVKNEFQLLQRIGFVKRDYDTLSNRNLMKLNFMRDQFGSLKMDDEFNYVYGMNGNDGNKQSSYNMKGYDSLTRRQKKEIQKQIEDNKRSQLSSDIKYVNELNKWENNNNNNNSVNSVMNKESVGNVHKTVSDDNNVSNVSGSIHNK